MDPLPASPRSAARRADPALRAFAGWVLVALLAALAVLAIRPAGAAEGEEEGLSDPNAFAETNYANVCAECHGSAGQGGVVPSTDEEAPPLAGEPGVTAAYLDLVLRTGRMPPPGDPFDNRARHVAYTDAERVALVDWITAEFGLEDDLPEVDPDGDIAVGIEVYSLNCAHCHGAAGDGGVAGARAWTPRINQLSSTAVVEAIRVGPFEMPQFSTDVITDEEADAVAAYLEHVREEDGTPVLGLVELNPVFASGFVALLAAGLIGSLLYIGGRPQPFERVPEDEIPTDVQRPTGQTPMPGDPAYEEAVDEATPVPPGAGDEPADPPKDTDHPPVPYLDEGEGTATSGQPQREQADEAGLDDAALGPDDQEDQQ